jgi:small ligand-binding sensory domain FIST
MQDPSSNQAFCCASALSTVSDCEQAVAQVCRQALGQLNGTPDLAVLFVSADRAGKCDQIAEDVCDRLGTDRLMGCTGESIVGTGQEVEGQTALSLWLARMPGTEVLPMHLAFERTVEGGSIVGWPDSLIQGWPSPASMLVLGDPFSFPADVLLDRMNEDRPGVSVIGGMASGGAAPGESRLLFGRQALDTGAVAVLLSGAIQPRSIVSQGCRPIGKHFVITKAERNVVYQLGGKPAVVQLHEILVQLPTSEQEMVRNGLHLGRVVSEYQDRFDHGDFLVRNVMGIDRESGALVIGDYVRVGQTVKFHIRDWRTADADLVQMLAESRQTAIGQPLGALLFTCNGRGTRLFPEPHHDALAIRNSFGEIPLAGFFAAGELGPVAGKNFVHGFTASIAIFDRPGSAGYQRARL